jgi:diguanylate cyclase (GGDEF)-like protein
MDLKAIIISNSFGMTLMAMLLVCSRRNVRRGDPAEKIFGWMIWLTAGLCAMEMLSFIIDGKHFFGARQLIYAVNSLLYAVNVAFLYLWVLYIDYKLFEDTARLQKRKMLLAAPGLAVLIMVLVNLFTPVIFSISPDNVYIRTKLTFVTFAVSFFYLGYSEYVVYTNRNNAQRYLFMPSVIFVLPILVCSVLQMLFYGLSLIWAALSISMVSVYINVQCGFSSVDSLSGVYTRQYLDDYLLRVTGEHAGKSLAGLMIDMDRFKEINDTLGHQTGDSAIRDFGHLLRQTADSRDVVARYGGDEFVVIRENAAESSIAGLAEEVRANVDRFNESGLRPYRLAYSQGIGCYVPGRGSLDDFLRSMDVAMYECKKKRSAAMPDRRGRSLSAR